MAKRKYTLKQIEEQLGGIYDLKYTYDAGGGMYTAKRKNVPAGENQHRRVFIGWSYDQIVRDHHIGETFAE